MMTKLGKQSYDKAVQYGLVEYYDKFMGNYQIDMNAYPSVKDKVDKFLADNPGYVMGIADKDAYGWQFVYICDKDDLMNM